MVVSSNTNLARVERNRDEEVDVVECRVFGQGEAELATHDDGELFVTVILYLMQYFLCLVFTFEEEESSGGLERDAAL